MKAHYKCGQRSALMISLRLMSPRGQEGPHGWSEEPVVCVCVCLFFSINSSFLYGRKTTYRATNQP